MATDLKIYGPIEIPFRKQTNGNAKRIETAHTQAFWNQAAARSIAAKQGCYVFALKAGRGHCPWYIGQATQSFEQESLATHQRNHYNDVLFDGRKGTPVLFFIAPKGNKKKVPADACDQIETLMIQSALIENPEIRNRQKTKIPEWTIEGVVRHGQGKPPTPAVAFRKMMGLSKG